MPSAATATPGCHAAGSGDSCDGHRNGALWSDGGSQGSSEVLISNKAPQQKAERLFGFLPTCCQRRALGLWLSVRSFVADQVRSYPVTSA
jgi:hypothetical protein